MLGVDREPLRDRVKVRMRAISQARMSYSIRVSIDQLEDMLFEELELPNLEQKQKDQLQTTEIVFHDIRKKGIMSNMDKKRTLIENLRRNANAGKSGLASNSRTILRYKTWNEIV